MRNGGFLGVARCWEHMDRKDWAHATSIRWEAQIQKFKKRFSNLNFGSFFWGTTFGHFGPFWAIFWWHVVKSSHRNAPKNYQRTKYPFEGETPHVAKRPTALRPCGIVADRENKIVAGVAKKGHPCQSRKTVSTLGCLFGSSQRYKAKCLKEQKKLNMT